MGLHLFLILWYFHSNELIWASYGKQEKGEENGCLEEQKRRRTFCGAGFLPPGAKEDDGAAVEQSAAAVLPQRPEEYHKGRRISAGILPHGFGQRFALIWFVFCWTDVFESAMIIPEENVKREGEHAARRIKGRNPASAGGIR